MQKNHSKNFWKPALFVLTLLVCACVFSAEEPDLNAQALSDPYFAEIPRDVKKFSKLEKAEFLAAKKAMIELWSLRDRQKIAKLPEEQYLNEIEKRIAPAHDNCRYKDTIPAAFGFEAAMLEYQSKMGDWWFENTQDNSYWDRFTVPKTESGVVVLCHMVLNRKIRPEVRFWMLYEAMIQHETNPIPEHIRLAMASEFIHDETYVYSILVRIGRKFRRMPVYRYSLAFLALGDGYWAMYEEDKEAYQEHRKEWTKKFEERKKTFVESRRYAELLGKWGEWDTASDAEFEKAYAYWNEMYSRLPGGSNPFNYPDTQKLTHLAKLYLTASAAKEKSAPAQKRWKRADRIGNELLGKARAMCGESGVELKALTPSKTREGAREQILGIIGSILEKHPHIVNASFGVAQKYQLLTETVESFQPEE